MTTTDITDAATAQEYRAARNGAAVFDRSEAGRISMAGKDCLDLLHRLSTQDLLPLQQGQGARTVLTSDKGRIIDVLTVYRLPDRLLLVTSPGRRADVLAWLDRYTFSEDSAAADATPQSALLVVVGPQAAALLGRAAGAALAGLADYALAAGSIAGVPVLLARGGEPAGGYRVVVIERQGGPAVRQALVDAGAATAGPAVYEALRIEEGIGAYGRELGEAYNPLEAQLRDCISFRKGCYIGQEVIARLDAYEKVQKLLMGILLPQGELPAPGVKLLHGEKEAGVVTSAAFSPALGRNIALAYVAARAAAPGASLTLAGTGASVEVVGLPFSRL